MTRKPATLLAALCLVLPPHAAPAESETKRPKNVLMILVDDLKPALGAYGDETAITPHMDALAARGIRFDLAYCNQAICVTSRHNLLLGSRSTSLGIYSFGSDFRDAFPDAVTLPQHFRQHGYRAEALGKVFHIGHGNRDDSASWSVPHFHDLVVEYLVPESTGGELTREEALFTNAQGFEGIGLLPRGAAWEDPDVDDLAYADGRVAAEAARRLRAAAEREDGEPFLMMVGMVRPHLPFSAPRRYWDLYDPATLPMPDFQQAPEGAPREAQKRDGEIAAYFPVPEREPGIFEEDLTRRLIHGYYASTSYADAQIGVVMRALDESGLADETIVVLWSDHGYLLGELGIWTKHVNYELANRIPLLIVAPGVTTPGSSTRQLTETVDLYPTLAELCGLPAPEGPQPIDGTSLVPVLKDPEARVRDHAYHSFRRERIGRAIRTERYRLVEWRAVNAPPESAALELYDYTEGPVERRNLADERPEVVAELRAILARHPEPVAPGQGRQAEP